MIHGILLFIYLFILVFICLLSLLPFFIGVLLFVTNLILWFGILIILVIAKEVVPISEVLEFTLILLCCVACFRFCVYRLRSASSADNPLFSLPFCTSYFVMAVCFYFIMFVFIPEWKVTNHLHKLLNPLWKIMDENLFAWVTTIILGIIANVLTIFLIKHLKKS
jgi:hypothetical protein